MPPLRPGLACSVLTEWTAAQTDELQRTDEVALDNRGARMQGGFKHETATVPRNAGESHRRWPCDCGRRQGATTTAPAARTHPRRSSRRVSRRTRCGSAASRAMSDWAVTDSGSGTTARQAYQFSESRGRPSDPWRNCRSLVRVGVRVRVSLKRVGASVRTAPSSGQRQGRQIG